MKETSSVSEILKELKKKFSLIIIDGVDGSGKSTIAREISQRLGYSHIELDKYLEKNRKAYVKYIKYNLLKDKIEGFNNPIIIEGVCVLAVLKKLKIEHDFLIYVKRMSKYGYWRDGNLYDVKEDVNGHISNQIKDYCNFSKALALIEKKELDSIDCSIPKLREEIIRYHFEFRPHEIADIIFNRID